MSEVLHRNMLFSCVHNQQFGTEQLVQHHALSTVISGTMEIFTGDGIITFPEGSMGIMRRNTLLKTKKHPASDGRPFKSFSLFLTDDLLQNYAARNGIPSQERFSGNSLVEIPQDSFFRGYFQSVIPYFDRPEHFNDRMAHLKSEEAIELLIQLDESFRQFLFDFHDPHKIDLEGFMLKNFMFNIPLNEFARLSGRSLSTFKRDFSKIFSDSPEKWLKHSRLSEAHEVIRKTGRKPSDVYLEVGFENFSHFSSAFKTRFGYNASSLTR